MITTNSVMLKSNRQKGFSLIEILVVLAMIGLLVIMLVPSFAGWLEKQRLEISAQEVGMFFTRARLISSSRAQVVRVRFEGLSYGIEVRTLLPDSSVTYRAPIGSSTGAGKDWSALMSSIEFDDPSYLLDFYYFQPDGTVTEDEGGVTFIQTQAIILKDSRENKMRVKLTSIGMVSIEKVP